MIDDHLQTDRASEFMALSWLSPNIQFSRRYTSAVTGSHLTAMATAAQKSTSVIFVHVESYTSNTSRKINLLQIGRVIYKRLL